MNKYNIYFSPAVYKRYFDVHKMSISSYNYYYLDVNEKDTNYAVIIRGWEASILYFYIQEQKKRARLYNKNGEPIISGPDEIGRYPTHIIRNML